MPQNVLPIPFEVIYAASDPPARVLLRTLQFEYGGIPVPIAPEHAQAIHRLASHIIKTYKRSFYPKTEHDKMFKLVADAHRISTEQPWKPAQSTGRTVNGDHKPLSKTSQDQIKRLETQNLQLKRELARLKRQIVDLTGNVASLETKTVQLKRKFDHEDDSTLCDGDNEGR